ncbi:MFS transporter [Lysinibacter cavernae]|nr:MFS transporter [Lysinibacter cavernae]
MSRRGHGYALLSLAALALLSVNLRIPPIAISPVIELMRADLGLTSAAAGLLTSIPVLCFGLITPFTSLLLRKIGVNHAVLYCLTGLIIGTIVRSGGTLTAAIGGTVIIGAALTIGNIAIPMLIGRDFKTRAVLVTGIYTASVNVGTTAAAALTAPFAEIVGWQLALANWAIFAVLALVLWVIVYPPHLDRPRWMDAVAPEPAKPVSKERAQFEELSTATIPIAIVKPGDSRGFRPYAWSVAWLLAIAFAAHNLAFYAVASWLPALLSQSQEMTPSQAGFAASGFQALAIVGPLLIPTLGAIFSWNATRLMVLVSSLWIAMPLGMLVAPSFWYLWVICGGMAQGATFTVIFSIVIQRTASIDQNRKLTAFVQTVGYTLAAAGPVVTGWLRDISDGWSGPLLAVLVTTVILAVSGIWAAKSRAPAPGY